MNTFNTQDWKEITPKCVFKIKATEDFMVEVCAWWSTPDSDYKSGWNWNVYAYVYDSHPRFDNDDWVLNLPLHCGQSYNQIFTQERLCKKYTKDTGKFSFKKVGSDYNHIYDCYDSHQNPQSGIPHNIMNDANELVEALIVEVEVS